MQYWIFFQAFAESTHSVSCAKVFCFCFISDGLLHSPYISRDRHFCLNTSPARESQHCCCRCVNVCNKEKNGMSYQRCYQKSTNVLSSKTNLIKVFFSLLGFTSCHLICICVNVYKQAELKNTDHPYCTTKSTNQTEIILTMSDIQIIYVVISLCYIQYAPSTVSIIPPSLAINYSQFNYPHLILPSSPFFSELDSVLCTLVAEQGIACNGQGLALGVHDTGDVFLWA